MVRSAFRLGISLLMVGASPSFALTSSQLLKHSPLAQYPSIKSVVSETLTSDSKRVKVEMNVIHDPTTPNDKSLYLNTCRSGADFIDTYAKSGKIEIPQQLAELAVEVVTWNIGLEAAGYPSQLWMKSISDYESEALAHMSANADDHFARRAAFEKILATKLNDYRSGHPQYPPVTDQDVDCGGGNRGVDLEIRTDPRGAQVILVTFFYYKLCKYQGIDPDDPSNCDHWKEAIDGSPTNVAGEYHYQARWSGGAVRRGTIDDASKKDGQVVVLSKP